jgi:thiol-disulfide isomerase/thioredoxin
MKISLGGTLMKNIRIGLFLYFLAAVLLVFSPLAGNAAASTKMPAFVLANVVDGKDVDSGDFQGKALLVTFFATWCPPCLREIPALVELQQEFAAKGFSVIGLSLDQGGGTEVAKLVERQAINYPVLMANAETAENFGGVFNIPVSFLVNKSGNVVKRYPGLVPHSTLAKDVRSVLE